MYCPKCGTQNTADQKYCRQCGLELSAVSLVVEGRVQDAITVLKKAQKPLLAGLIGIGLFLVTTATTIATNGRVGFLNPASALIFLVVVLVFLSAGAALSRRACRLFDARDRDEEMATDRARQEEPRSTHAMPAIQEPDAQIPLSVTEVTTKELQRKGIGDR